MTRVRVARDERGVVLPLALIVLLVLAAHSALLLASARSELGIAANHLESTRAHYLAEAGLEDAFAALRVAPERLAAAPSSLVALADLAGPGPALGRLGGYAVRYQRAGDGTVDVVATGTASRGAAERVVRATVSNRFRVRHAMLAHGDLSIDGATRIAGPCGNVHANGDLTIAGGNAEVEGRVTASGRVSGMPETPAGTVSAGEGGARRQALPAVGAATMLATAQADAAASAALYALTRAGAVLRWNPTAKRFEPVEDQATPAATRVILGGSRPGWTWAAGSAIGAPRWELAGSPSVPGTFYVEGDIRVAWDAPGDAPWSVTLIATDTEPAGATARGGNITVTGNPHLRAHLPGILLAADRDVRIEGAPVMGRSHYEGVVLAREQVDVSQSPAILGAVIARDEETLSATVLGPGSRISGAAVIEARCDLEPPLWGPLAILAWGP